MEVPTYLFLAQILASLVNYTVDYSDTEGMPEDTGQLEEEYDYIVVGAGSAGSVLGARLSEDPDVRVLVLEAGGGETDVSEVPMMCGYLQHSEMDWGHKSEPSSHACLAMTGGRCNLPRGKALGGSSAINYMVYVRGNRRDFDQWAAMGNDGWSFQEVLPYFIKMEDNQDPELAADTEYHNTGGPLTVGTPPWTTPLAEAFVKAGEELGYPRVDYNGANQTGFRVPQAFLRRAARCSNAKAYLRPVRKRPNLHLGLHTHVTRVLLRPKSLRAYGVEALRGGTRVTLRARHEVILSAGAINTPQILMLSGIGPGRHLREKGLPLVSDLPVGHNLMDHIAGGVIFLVEEPVSLMTNRVITIPTVLDYVLRGSGPLTSLGGLEGVAFVKTKYANRSDDWPDIEFHFVSGSHASDAARRLRDAVGLSEDFWNGYFKNLAAVDHFSILAKLMRPRSRGRIELRSREPLEHPKVTTNYLTDPMDVLVLVEGMKIAAATGTARAFRRFGSRLYAHPIPGCLHETFGSDAFFECSLRHMTYTIYHYSGTAKMGPFWDSEAVVDPELRVYGVSGLRVVDASIFPAIPTGNTNAAVTMVAEKAADLIKSSRRQYLQQQKSATPSGARKGETKSDHVQKVSGSSYQPEEL